VAQGNEDFDSEDLLAYELGFRANPSPALSFDLALFYNEYDNLRTIEASAPRLAPDGPYLVFATPFANKASGNLYGLELAAEWLVRPGWRLASAYGFAEADLSADRDSVDISNDAFAETLPRHQLSLRSMMNLGPHMDLDVWVRYVDGASGFRQAGQLARPQIEEYWDLDVRLAWRPRKGVELALVGQNLLQDSRLEGNQEILAVADSEAERGVYGTVKLEF
jgi:iron complex outermembrane receptor protein